MRSIILMTVFLQFYLLVVYQSGIQLLQLIYLQVKAVNHALQFGNVSTGCMDFEGAALCVLSPVLKLLIQAIRTINQSSSLLVEHSDPGVLSKTLLFPL